MPLPLIARMQESDRSLAEREQKRTRMNESELWEERQREGERWKMLEMTSLLFPLQSLGGIDGFFVSSSSIVVAR